LKLSPSSHLSIYYSRTSYNFYDQKTNLSQQTSIILREQAKAKVQ